MSNFVSVILCSNCHSRYVEITEWTNEKKAIIYCRTCNNREEITNFTLGRCKVSNIELQKIRDTKAVPGKAEK